MSRASAISTALGLALLISASPVGADEATPDVLSTQGNNRKPTNLGSGGSGDNFLFTGSYLYSVPIAIPPGIAGMQPELALQYNSSAGLGWVGLGWDISMGSIQRMTKNGSPKYDATDSFVVNFKGQSSELVKIGDGTYRAKIIGGFEKFIFDGLKWVVIDKTGTRFIFGDSSDNCITNPRGTFLWGLNRATDRNGNTMQVNYTKVIADNQLYLSEILYTSNDAAGKVADRRVVFNREQIPSNAVPVYSLSSGFPIATRFRLKNITSYDRTNTVWKYDLTYTVSVTTKRCLLTQVKRFGLDGVTTFPLTQFDYSSSDVPLSFSGGYNVPGSDFSRFNENFIIGDFDGDGTQDYMAYSMASSPFSSDHSSLALSNGNGTFHVVGGMPKAANDGNVIYLALGGDFNGDGKTDIAVGWWATPVNNGTNCNDVRIFLSNGDGSFRLACSIPRILSFSANYLNTVLGDFDGNGTTDIADWGNGSSTVGSDVILFDKDGNYRVAAELPGPPPNSATVYQSADFNGDGKSDLIAYRRGDLNYACKIWMSRGDGNFDAKTNITNNVDWGANSTAVAVTDLNRDGLSDVIIWPERMLVYPPVCAGGCIPHIGVLLSKGDGTFTPGGGLGYEIYGGADAYSRLRTGDFNGDGAMDLVLFDGGARHYGDIWLGNGDGSLTGWGHCPGNDFTQARNNVIAADFTGDARADLLVYRFYDPGYSGGIFTARPTSADLLTMTTNGIGGTSKVAYRYSSEFPNRNLPFPIPVMGKLLTLDGRCNYLNNECPNTTYSYLGGYYDSALREFLGFSRVDATDAQGNISTTHFLQDQDGAGNPVPQNAMKGRISTVERKNSAGQALASEETHWEYKMPFAGAGAYFVRPAWKENSLLDVSPPQKSRVEFTYDDAPAGPGYGNITQTNFEGDPAITGDEHTEFTEYSVNTAVNLLNFPKRTMILGPSGTTLSEIRYIYDGSATLGTITKGNVTDIQRWRNLPSAKLISNKSEYNLFGQATAVVDSNGHRTTTVFDAFGFPLTVTNALMQSVQTTYDPATGLLLTEKDINNQITNHRYDTMGRPTKLIGPLDSDTYPTMEYIYHDELLGNTSLQNIEERRRTVSGTLNSIWSRSFFDGLGRSYRDEQQDNDSNSTITETLYDNRDLPFRTSVPRFTTPYTAPQWTETMVDGLGRVTEIRKPDNTSTRTTYEGRTTRVQDANGHIQISETDAQGRVVRRFEPGVSNPTVYDYDPLGRLVRTTDSQGKITTFTFDSLGRKLGMVDPNAGSWSYSYDDDGNLLEQTDARGVKVATTYDAVNRQKQSKLTADPGGQTGQPVGTVLATYTYDEVVAGWPYSKGHLTTAVDLSGTSRLYHDPLGRILRESKQIGSVLYEVKTQYDDLGRPTQITYPSDRVIKNIYDEAGRLRQITNADGSVVYGNYTDYNALNQPLTFEQGNAVTRTSYSYDSLRHILASLSLASSTGTSLQQLAYTFDPLGNLKHITDQLDARTNQDFGYDSLDRLEQAKGLYGTENYSYDDLGNFHAKGSLLYDYKDPLHPYAVTATGPSAPPAQDASTLIAWNLDPSEPIYSLSGQIKNSAGTVVNNVPVVLAGAFEEAVFTGATSTSANAGRFLIRGIATGEGSVHSLFPVRASSRFVPTGYSFNPLASTQQNLNFAVYSDTNPALVLTGLRVPRTVRGDGGPQGDISSGTWVGGLIGDFGFGGMEMSVSSLTCISGYSPLPDPADAVSVPPNPVVPPPTATVTGTIGPGFVAGIYQQALSFNGKSDVFVFPESAELAPAQFSLMMWVKPLAYPPNTGLKYATLMAKSTGSALGQLPNGFRLVMNPTGKLIFEIGRSSLTSVNVIPLNKWTYLSATFDGATMKIYLNGHLDIFRAATPTPVPNTVAASLAASMDLNRRAAAGTYFSGTLDEPRLQSRTWTADEIMGAYQTYNGIANYAYDSAGNMVSKKTGESAWNYRFDAEGRLNQVTENGAVKATFIYDGNGGRVKKVSAAGTTLYIGKLFETRPDGTNVDHVFAGGQLIADIVKSTGTVSTSGPTSPSAGGDIGPLIPPPPPPPPTGTSFDVVTYYHSDQSGSVSLATDDQGRVLQRTDYDPFGRTIALAGASITHIFYTGQELDGEIGLYYFNARYLDPILGRFISADTVVQNPADPQFMNRYAYARNNPVLRADPSGHFAFLIPIIAGAVFGALSSGVQSNWDSQAMWQGALIGAVAGAAGAGASGLAGGGMTGSVLGGMTAGATAGGMAAAQNDSNIFQGMLTGAIMGGIGGGIYGGIGNYYGDNWSIGRIFLQGSAGGGMAELQGGSFKQGFEMAGGAALAMKGWQMARDWTVRSQLEGTERTIYNRWGEPVVAGTRACPECGPPGFADRFLSKIEMLPHDSEINRIFGVRYSIDSEFGRFINNIGGVHDFWNGWNYSCGDVMPGNAGFQLFFGAWSFSGMPIAAAYTSYAFSAQNYQPYFQLKQE